MYRQINCEIIEDLLPLYVDNCCSEESKIAVEHHLESCPKCTNALNAMKDTSLTTTTNKTPSQKLSRVNEWKASLLQSILLFAFFGLITLGVSFEAATGYFNMFNGFWAFLLVIPSTAFMLSMVNWCFIRLYKSKKQFSNVSFFLTALLLIISTIWGIFHYEINVDFFDTALDLIKNGNVLFIGLMFLWVSIAFLSKIISNKFADLLGKL